MADDIRHGIGGLKYTGFRSRVVKRGELVIKKQSRKQIGSYDIRGELGL